MTETISRNNNCLKRSTIICYQLTCYPLACYQLTCYQTHLLSTHLLSHSFAIKPHLLSGLNSYRHTCYQASLAIRAICYQSSVAINNFSINHHLLSNFRLALNHYFNQFFFLKIRKKMEKFLKIWNSSVYIIYLSLVIIYSNNIFIYCHIFRKNCDSKLFHSLGH